MPTLALKYLHNCTKHDIYNKNLFKQNAPFFPVFKACLQCFAKIYTIHTRKAIFNENQQTFLFVHYSITNPHSDKQTERYLSSSHVPSQQTWSNRKETRHWRHCHPLFISNHKESRKVIVNVRFVNKRKEEGFKFKSNQFWFEVYWWSIFPKLFSATGNILADASHYINILLVIYWWRILP